MKLLNAFFVAIFTLSAAIQYNDPDPLLWMLIYGYGVLVCLLSVVGKDIKLLHYVGILLFLPYSLYLFFTPNGVLSWITAHGTENITGSMSEKKPWIESTREFFGLLILICAFLLNLIFRKNHNQQNLIP